MPLEQKLVINLPDGSVSIRFSPHSAQDLLTYLYDFTSKLQKVATDRRTPDQPIEYRYVGEVFLEVFGNPNIWPSSFAAKVLITLRDDRIRLTSEIGLTRLIEDVQQYLETVPT